MQRDSREISVSRERGGKGKDVELSRVVTTEEARAGSRPRDSSDFFRALTRSSRDFYRRNNGIW